jgi:NDP-sugar pyrophosphorylase family protein
LKAVIIAGGKGTRLKPYTTFFPKPLMPIGDKPILEVIVRQLKAQDFKEIIMLVGYLGELIMNFFGDGSKYGVTIKYYKEEKPLGTAGGLGLLKSDLDADFLTINGDTLTTLNFKDLVSYHRSNGAIATIALNRRQVRIDFGVVEVDTKTDVISGYSEKPTLETFVSMGVNALSAEVLQYIKPDEHLDFPELIQGLISNRKTVKGFIFEGYWLDIGRPDDYERANLEIDEICGRFGID